MKFGPYLLLILLFCCNQQNQNKVPVQEVIKSHEIKQLSDAEVLMAGEAFAKGFFEDSVQHTWKIKRQESSSCFELLTFELANQTICKLGFGLEDFSSDLEYQLFEAYAYSIQHNLEANPSIQRLNRNMVLYCLPISTAHEYFLDCQVQSKMPKDSIPSFGMWSIQIPVKEIVKSM